MSRSQEAMSTVTPMYGWNTISWRKIQRNVFKLQKRIYQASREVRMTNARLLRSRMKGNLHVRFCSRVMMVTSWLRQRAAGQANSIDEREICECKSID